MLVSRDSVIASSARPGSADQEKWVVVVAAERPRVIAGQRREVRRDQRDGAQGEEHALDVRSQRAPRERQDQVGEQDVGRGRRDQADRSQRRHRPVLQRVEEKEQPGSDHDSAGPVGRPSRPREQPRREERRADDAVDRKPQG